MGTDYTYSKINIYHPTPEELKEQAIALLKGYGFKEDQIIEECAIHSYARRYGHRPPNTFRVDFAGVSENLKVGVEIGKCSPTKLFALKADYDKVVWLPYWLTEMRIKADSTIEEKIEGLENKIAYLKEEIEREKRKHNTLKDRILKYFREFRVYEEEFWTSLRW